MPLHVLCSQFPSPCDLIFPLSSSQNEPKRLKKYLPKLLKLLRPDDRILIVGTTHRPFDAELQSFCRVYQKIILVPRPDYASRYGKYHRAFHEALRPGTRACLQASRAGELWEGSEQCFSTCGSQPLWGIEYQISYISDIYITIHHNTKLQL